MDDDTVGCDVIDIPVAVPLTVTELDIASPAAFLVARRRHDRGAEPIHHATAVSGTHR
jgi:hypothetical protein